MRADIASSVAKASRAAAKLRGAKARLVDLRVVELSLCGAGANGKPLLLRKHRTASFGEVLKRAEAARQVLVAKLDTRAARVLKASARETDEQRYVLGIVLEPEAVDSQGDTYDAGEIRRAAWEYMERFRNVGLSHKQLINGRATLVESYIAPVDFNVGTEVVKAGTWLAGFYVPDEALWKQVKSGEIGGLSMGGMARRVDP